MHILCRDYDVAPTKIKGIEKLEQKKLEEIDKCKLTRQIVVLDETEYYVNSDGNPEMTLSSQKEYDEFVSQIHKMIESENIRILDEGYGVDEDELEWRITACVMDDTDSVIIGIMEIDTCVRTDEEI